SRYQHPLDRSPSQRTEQVTSWARLCLWWRSTECGCFTLVTSVERLIVTFLTRRWYQLPSTPWLLRVLTA
ncbi:hypothetical protein FOZ63_033299, partial [Perkinsus olseni]